MKNEHPLYRVGVGAFLVLVAFIAACFTIVTDESLIQGGNGNVPYLAKTSSTYTCSQCWPMRSVVLTSFSRNKDHAEFVIKCIKVFIMLVFCNFLLDDRCSTCKSCFSFAFPCSDNMFHRPRFTAKMCRVCSDQVWWVSDH